MDLKSNLEIADVMLGSYSRKSISGDRNDQVDFGPDRSRQDIIQNSEDFRSLLNPNSRETSESTIETMRLVISEVSKKIDELKRDLNTQLVETLNSENSEKVFPNIQKDQSEFCVSGRSGP